MIKILKVYNNKNNNRIKKTEFALFYFNSMITLPVRMNLLMAVAKKDKKQGHSP